MTQPTTEKKNSNPEGELDELINELPIVHQFGCPALERYFKGEE